MLHIFFNVHASGDLLELIKILEVPVISSLGKYKLLSIIYKDDI